MATFSHFLFGLGLRHSSLDAICAKTKQATATSSQNNIIICYAPLFKCNQSDASILKTCYIVYSTFSQRKCQSSTVQTMQTHHTNHNTMSAYSAVINFGFTEYKEYNNTKTQKKKHSAVCLTNLGDLQ